MPRKPKPKPDAEPEAAPSPAVVTRTGLQRVFPPNAGVDEEGVLGLRCPKCWCRHFIVIRTERLDGSIRRRRECRHCGFRATTYESFPAATPAI